MPPIYSSSNPNIIQPTTENNTKSQIQSTGTFTTTVSLRSTTTSSYALTIATPAKGLSETAIVFIVFAVLIVSVGLCVLIYWLYRRRKHKRLSSAATPKPAVAFVAPPVGRVKPPVKVVAPLPLTPVHPKPHPIRGHAPPGNPQPSLPLLSCIKPLCREYLKQLDVNQAYFNSKHDKCWCSTCHDPSSSDCGNWCRQQHGWIRFGLSINKAHQKQWSIFKDWKTSFYGTSSDRLSSIINNRFLPLDGDELSNGIAFNSGHPDPTSCTTSPSLVCTSQRKYSTPSHFRARDGAHYDVQLVLQCKQKPDTYSIHGNSFHSIEWTTTTRASALPYGLFMRLRRQKI